MRCPSESTVCNGGALHKNEADGFSNTSGIPARNMALRSPQLTRIVALPSANLLSSASDSPGKPSINSLDLGPWPSMSLLARDQVEHGVPNQAAQMTPERIQPNNSLTTSGQRQSMLARSSTRTEPMPLCSMHADIPPSPANSSRKTLLCPFFRECESATRRSRFSSRTLSAAEGSTNGGRRPPPPGRRDGGPVARTRSHAGSGRCSRPRPR